MDQSPAAGGHRIPQEENRVLREKLGTKRVLLGISQKRRLGTAAFKVGRKLLAECTTFFSPETLLRWHRTLVAGKYDGSGKRGPKAKKANEIRQLVLRMKADNPCWGYGHIHGELKGLGFKVSWQTVRRMMIEHGLLDGPKHKKKMPWSTFIKAHFESIGACDFFAAEAWTPKALTLFLVYLAIDTSTLRIEPPTTARALSTNSYLPADPVHFIGRIGYPNKLDRLS